MGIGEELTTAQRDHVSSMSPEKRATFMRQQRAALQAHTQSIDAAVEPHQRVIRGMMPKTTTLATGAVGALVAHAAMSVIDPENKMNRVAQEATEGALAGAAGVGLSSAVGASAALGPEMLAGASAYIAGTESARAITQGLERGGMSQDAAQGVGSVSGGAIGGVTAAGVSAGATVLGSMAFGVEVGDAIGVVGGPVGMAIGAAAGATLGATIGGVGYLFSSHQHRSDGRMAALIRQQQQLAAARAAHLAALAEEAARIAPAMAEQRARHRVVSQKAFDREQEAQAQYDRQVADKFAQRAVRATTTKQADRKYEQEFARAAAKSDKK